MTKGPFPVCAPGAHVEGLPVDAWFTPMEDRHECINIEEWGKPCKEAAFCTMKAKNQAPRWWFELEIFSSQWRHIRHCDQVFHKREPYDTEGAAGASCGSLMSRTKDRQ